MPAGQLVFDTIIALVKWKIRKLNTKKQTKNTTTRNVWVGWREESEAGWSKRERQRQTETETHRDRDIAVATGLLVIKTFINNTIKRDMNECYINIRDRDIAVATGLLVIKTFIVK